MASRTSEAHGQLLKELNAERLAALTRIAGTLSTTIDQMRELHARIPTLPPVLRDRELEIYNNLRERARKYRWYLEVQREALGLRQHRELDEFYPIPGPLEVEAARG